MPLSTRSRRLPGLAVFALIAAAALAPPAEARKVVFARDVALSPDGSQLAFSWSGDIWTVPTTGGDARRLTIHPANESHPVWSPDGEHIAFTSNRYGNGNVFESTPRGANNIFMVRADGTALRRLTFADTRDTPTDFSPDGKWIYFHAQREEDVYREPRLYRVPTAGGQPWRVLDCFGSWVHVSPDGEQLAFCRGGLPWVRWSRRNYRGSASLDIYTYNRATDTFRVISDFDGADRVPQWNADGTGLYYMTDRSGTINVWFQALTADEPEQVTRMTDEDVREFSVSRDGQTLAFTHWDEIYVMSTDDQRARVVEVHTPEDLPLVPVERETLTNSADEAEPSPDGKEIAIVVRGEIYVLKAEDGFPTRQVTDSAARDHDVVWSPDGKALYFVSDRDGKEDIYRATSAEEPAKALSDSYRFKIERVTEREDLAYNPKISPDGKHLAYVHSRGDLIVRDLKAGTEKVLLESWDRPNFQWSPNSDWMLYSVEDVEHNSEIYIVPVNQSSAPVNISQHPDYDGGAEWSADGQMVAFASARHGFDGDLYVVFLSPELDEMSRVQRDAYFKKAAGKAKKRKPLNDAVASGDIVLAGEAPETQPADEEDEEEAEDEAEDETQEAETKPAETQPTETQPVSEEDALKAKVQAWIKAYLEKDNEEKKPKPTAKKDEKKDKDDDKKKEDKLEYDYELDTCYRRIRRVTNMPGDQFGFAFSPDGKTLAFTSRHEGSPKLYTIEWDGGKRKSIVNGGVGAVQYALNGSKIYYLQGGVPRSISASGSGAKRHGFRASQRVDRVARARQKFNDGARRLGMIFYHPTMKGLDWPALTDKYRELALQTTTLNEFNEIFNMLLGELNASHLGIYGPRGGTGQSVGQLGCWFDPDHAGPGLKVARVLKDSPADRKKSRLYPGDVILTVNGEPVGPDRSIEAALIETSGEEVILEYEPSPDRPADEAKEEEDEEETTDEEAVSSDEPEDEPADPTDPPGDPDAVDADRDDEDGAEAQDAADSDADDEEKDEDEDDKVRELIIRPVSRGAIDGLMYNDWVEQNRKYVEEKSDGRLGYLHIRSMDEPSFERFERDLYAAAHGKDGLIIDVRSNGGGWTADWVMAVLTVQRHAYTIQRGATPGYPQDRLIFYAWTKPATMMCNHQSFSNAEIVSHAFKNLGRGPLVGTTTYGGVISTGGYTLVDGALVRMPGRGWYTLPDGVDMENHGAEPDVQVPIKPEDEIAGRHPQLDAAIKATLEQLDGSSQASPAP
jgi:tricorn protease